MEALKKKNTFFLPGILDSPFTIPTGSGAYPMVTRVLSPGLKRPKSDTDLT
jgi:hypothetical protein